MAENIVELGVDRVRTAVRRADRRIQKAQKQIAGRRRSLEKDLAGRRKKLQQRAEKQVSRFVSRAQKLPLVKRLEDFADGASRQFESGMESVLGALQIASRGDVDRIDRKLGQISRKLKDLEKLQQESESPAA